MMIMKRKKAKHENLSVERGYIYYKEAENVTSLSDKLSNT